MPTLRKALLILLPALIICGGGAYVIQFYIPEQIDARVNTFALEFATQNRILGNRIQDLENENKNLKEKLQNLGQSVVNLENSGQESSKTVAQTRVLKPNFKKWESWCALKKKLKQRGSYASELAEFQKNFADHPEILQMVADLDKNNLETRHNLINNLLDLLKIRYIDEYDLAKISGYVLLSSLLEEYRNE